MYNEDISVKNENKITNLSVVLNGVDVMKNSYSYKYGYMATVMAMVMVGVITQIIQNQKVEFLPNTLRNNEITK